MKVLILEDNIDKRNSIVGALNASALKGGTEIFYASNSFEALECLRGCAFDLLILDLVVPIRKAEAATPFGGKMVLDEVIEGGLKIPTHIICITAFESESGVLNDAINSKLVHLVIYSEVDDAWMQVLISKVCFIDKRLSQSSVDPHSPADIIIVTSSSPSELRAVKQLPGGFVAEYNREDEIYYYLAEWIGPDERKIAVAACAAPSMGMTAACVTAMKAIKRWRPRFVVMTGIAASTIQDQKLGDILCVETAYDYGSGKIVEVSEGEKSFLPSPHQRCVDPGILEILKHWERDQSWINDIVSQCKVRRPGDNIPSMVVGVMASGAAVIQSKTFAQEIMQTSRKTVGLDMECYGIFQACALAGANKPTAIVAKSISDYADMRKSDEAHDYASYTSARFVYMLLTMSSEIWL